MVVTGKRIKSDHILEVSKLFDNSFLMKIYLLHYTYSIEQSHFPPSVPMYA